MLITGYKIRADADGSIFAMRQANTIITISRFDCETVQPDLHTNSAYVNNYLNGEEWKSQFGKFHPSTLP